MNQEILFRTDASHAIGTGHVMRCLTLAEALRERGASCRFVCRAHPGNLIDMIRQRGFVVHALPLEPNWQHSEVTPTHAAWLGADWQTDAEQTKNCISENAIDWLIVDHYALDARWESIVRPYCSKLMVIDDLADRPHDCDLLLDQNLGREPVDYEAFTPVRCRHLIGPQYALLRPEFAAARARSLLRRQTSTLKRLLITMGGVDQPNATGKVLEALKSCPLPADCEITVVMGTHTPWLEQVRALAATMPWPTEVRINVNNMAQVMADSDLAIGAAGSSSWERCCLGLPALLLVLADNQRIVASALHAAGAALLIEEPAPLSVQLISVFRKLLASELLIEMSLAARPITGGEGTARIAQYIEYQE